MQVQFDTIIACQNALLSWENAPAPIYYSSISQLRVLNALPDVKALLLSRVSKPRARLCCSVLVFLLELLQAVAQKGRFIVSAPGTLLSICIRQALVMP